MYRVRTQVNDQLYASMPRKVIKLYPDFANPREPELKKVWFNRLLKHPRHGIVGYEFEGLIRNYISFYALILLGLLASVLLVEILSSFPVTLKDAWAKQSLKNLFLVVTVPPIFIIILSYLSYEVVRSTVERWIDGLDILIGSSLGVGRSINRYVITRLIISLLSSAAGLVLACTALYSNILPGVLLYVASILLAFGSLMFRSTQKELRRSAQTVFLHSIPETAYFSQNDSITISHWSDLHLTASDEQPLVEDRLLGRRVPAVTNRFFSHLLETEEWNDSEAIIVTGDITDTGVGEEWNIFRNAIDANASIGNKIVLVPGNHDINIVDKPTLFKVESGDRTYLKLRLMRTILALDMVQGHRAQVIDENGKLRSVRKYVGSFAALFEEFINDPPRTTYELRIRGSGGSGAPSRQYETIQMSDEQRRIFNAPNECWDKLFPMVVPLENKNAAIVVCNSVKTQTSMVDNAIGEIDEAQLLRLQAIPKLFPRHALIYALHHHIKLPALAGSGRWLENRWSDIQVRMMALRNADDMLNSFPSDRNTVVFHGHRHYEYDGYLNSKVQVFSARSTTLGGQSAVYPPGFKQYTLGMHGNSTSLARSTLHLLSKAASP